MSFSSLSARGLAGYCLVFSVESFPAPLVWLFGLSLLLQSRSKMVNTRRKSQVLPIDPSAAEQSDSSTTSTTRRSTRRSVVLATPVEIPTPTRRSRRLSNSSVESANNDTPRPGTRRSSRINKLAGSDVETSDVELVVIKRRKLGEGVDTLIPIREEKNEDRAKPSENKEKHILVELEEDIEDEIKNKSNEVEVLNTRNETEKDKIVKAEVDNRSNEAEDNKIVKAEVDSKCNEAAVEAVLPSKKIDDDIIKQQSPVKESKAGEMKTEDTDSHEAKLEDLKLDEIDNSSLKSEIAIEIVEACKENSHSSEENHHEKFFTPVSTPTNFTSEVEDATKQTEKMDCTTSEEQPLTAVDVVSAKSHDEEHQEENKCPLSPLKEINVEADSPVKPVVEKPRMLFGVPANMIKIGPTLNMNKIGKHLYFSKWLYLKNVQMFYIYFFLQGKN